MNDQPPHTNDQSPHMKTSHSYGPLTDQSPPVNDQAYNGDRPAFTGVEASPALSSRRGSPPRLVKQVWKPAPRHCAIAPPGTQAHSGLIRVSRRTLLPEMHPSIVRLLYEAMLGCHIKGA